MSNIVSIQGYQVEFHNGKPMIQDLELAKKLGYERPRSIRKLIKRMIDNKQLDERHMRSTVERLTNGQQSTSYYLGEKAALKVITKSETEKADQITDEMIDVFIEVRNGTFQKAQPSNTGEITDSEKAVLDILLEHTSLDKRLDVIKRFGESKGVDTSYMENQPNPVGRANVERSAKEKVAYIDSRGVTYAMSTLLEKHEAEISAQRANKVLIELGLLESKTRPSRSGKSQKEFKHVTKLGEAYGKNLENPKNPVETQPHWYEHSFLELLSIVEKELLKEAS